MEQKSKSNPHSADKQAQSGEKESMVEPAIDLSTLLFYSLLLISNMIGSGCFHLWIIIEDLNHPISDLMKIGGILCFSLYCFSILLNLMDKYKKDNYLDLVEEMTSSLCAKMAALVFFVAQVMSLASLIGTSRKKMKDLALMFKELDENEQGLYDVTSFIIACIFIKMMSPLTKATRYGAHQPANNNVGNTVNITSCHIDSMAINNNPNVRAEPERNGRQGIARLLGCFNSVVMLLLLFTYTALLVIEFMRGRYQNQSASLDTRSSWYAMPTLVFATCTLAYMIEIPQEGRKCLLVGVRRWKTWGVVGALACVVYIIGTLIFLSRYGSMYDEKSMTKTKVLLCVLAIIICTVAASIRLEPVSQMYEKVVPDILQEITQDGALCYYGFHFATSLLVAYFVSDDVETIIAYCGCTVMPFLMWFVPHVLSVLDLWRHQESNGSDRFSKHKHILILLGITVFIVAHFVGIRSQQLRLS